MPARSERTTETTATHSRTKHRHAFGLKSIPLKPRFTHLSPCEVGATRAVLLPSGSTAKYEEDAGISAYLHTPLEEDLLTAVGAAPNGKFAVLAHRSGFVRMHPLPPSDPPSAPRSFRPFHSTNIVVLIAIHPTSRYTALAAADGSIRVYDTDSLAVTHVLSTGTILTALAFPPSSNNTLLVAGCEDGSIRLFDLSAKIRSPKLVLRSHVARITALLFPTPDILVSGSLDSTLAVQPLTSKKTSAPVLLNGGQPIVAAAALSDGRVVVASSSAILRVWDVASRAEDVRSLLKLPFVRTSTNDSDPDEEDNEDVSVTNIVSTYYGLLVALSDQTLLRITALKNAPLTLQPLVECGNLEEIYDVRFIPPRKGSTGLQIGVASNSPVVWVMNPPTLSNKQWSCAAALFAHRENVLAVDFVSVDGACFAASASRDRTARVWYRSLSGHWTCVATAEGHADAVATVSFSPSISGKFFMVTAAADRTIKVWDLNTVRKAEMKKEKKVKAEGLGDLKTDECHIIDVFSSESTAQNLSARWTILAHEKDINAVAVSPDGMIVASGSQDRTLKLWSANAGSPLHTCTGHRRGIWSLAFSPVDKIIASASGDASVRLWSVQHGTCLRTLQGHMSGVLRVAFLSRGTQIVSSGADGLLKLWTTRSGECDVTVDGHEDRVWGLDVANDGDVLVSGGGDGRVSLWKDESEDVELAEAKRQEEQAMMSQVVESAARKKEWSIAAMGAIELGMTQKLKSIVSEAILSSDEPEQELIHIVKSVFARGNNTATEVKEVSDGMEEESNEKRWGRIGQIIGYCRDWNAVGGPKSAAVAAYLLQAIMSIWTVEELCDNLPSEKRALVEALDAHCNRHIERVNRLATKVTFLEHTLFSMRGVVDVDIKPRVNKSRLAKDSRTELHSSGKRKERDVDFEY